MSHHTGHEEHASPHQGDPGQGCEGSATGHRDTEIKHRSIVVITVAFFALCGISMVLMYGMTYGLQKYVGDQYDAPDAMTDQRATKKTGAPPDPKLQRDPTAQLKSLRSAEAAQLNGFGWTDPTQAIARIPVDAAIGVAVKRGFPVRSAEWQGARRGAVVVPTEASLAGGRH